MSGHRQAAAALYSLAASDQQRILSELPDGDQLILKDYLGELAALGFDKAANMSDAAAAPVTAPVAIPADPLARLRGAPAAAVMAVLAHEPASLVAQVLSLQAWPWSAELLALLPAQRSKLVRDAVRDAGPVAPARARFLTDALLGALDASLPHAPAMPAAGAAPRLTRWLPWTR